MTTQYIIRTQPQALDMPDGPGWWAFVQNGGTSYERKDIASWNFFKTEGNQISLRWGDDTYTMRYTLEKFGNMYSNAKWYRLTMPWDTQHTITATVHNGTVEESLRSIVPQGVEAQRVWEVTPERVEALKRILGGPDDSPMMDIFRAEEIAQDMLDEAS